MKNIINSNTYFIHCLCDDIIMTSSFAINVLCTLSNTTTSCFSYKCHLQLKLVINENMQISSSESIFISIHFLNPILLHSSKPITLTR